MNKCEMKKHFLNFSMLLCMVFAPLSGMSQSETAIVKTGTQIELQSVKTVYARELSVGDNVKFKVAGDVLSSGKVLIHSGLIADGVVTEAKKSSLAGTKGRLGIDIKSLTLDDGTKIPLSGTVRISGKNRTPLAVITGVFVWPCIFIPGTSAVMTEGHNVTATVLTNTEIKVAGQ